MHESATPDHNSATPENSRPSEPCIYVASLSDYNAGILHGRWITAVADEQAMLAEIDEMLATSPVKHRYGEPAEEWAIHDYDGFAGLRLEEHEDLGFVAHLAAGVEQHGPAFAAWIGCTGERNRDLIDEFDEHYQGEWDSVEAYAEFMLDEYGVNNIIDDAPDWLQPYISIDTEAFGHDLQYGGDIVAIERPDGGVWIFDV